MDVDDLVRHHYGGDDLAARVTEALRRVGIPDDGWHVDHLSGLDQLHAGSAPSTEYVLDHLSLTPDLTLLDVGCGIGGPARLAASRHGCSVLGIDLSDAFVDLARWLTERVSLGEQVRFDVGSALDLPYDTGSVDRLMTIHVGMNIADKAGAFREARRVVAPGGLVAVYDQMRTGDGDLRYPLPWADDERSSFVETQDHYVELLTSAGFEIVHQEDRTAANAAAGPPTGPLWPGDLFGQGFDERLGNNIAAAIEGTLGAILIVARAV
jgi:SAM-dependent methyltransferase